MIAGGDGSLPRVPAAVVETFEQQVPDLQAAVSGRRRRSSGLLYHPDPEGEAMTVGIVGVLSRADVLADAEQKGGYATTSRIKGQFVVEMFRPKL